MRSAEVDELARMIAVRQAEVGRRRRVVHHARGHRSSVGYRQAGLRYARAHWAKPCASRNRMSFADWLFGRPLASDEERAQKIGPLAGIPIFCLDALGSA